MENEKKNASSQNVLNVILVIICGAIMGLFVYDYINKNDQIAEYKQEGRKLRENASKERLAKANRLANIYKQTSLSNTSEGFVNDEDSERIKRDIARNVSSKLSPIMAKMDRGQDITNDKLDKIMNELIELLEKETKKSVSIRKQMSAAINKERRIEAKLQKDLTETQKVVADLNGMLGELKGRYIGALEEDSALGDIARCASAPAKFLGNTLTLDWWVSRNKRDAKKEIDAKQEEIMDRYDAIGNPVALRRLKMLRRKQIQKKRRHKRRNLAEPELIKKK